MSNKLSHRCISIAQYEDSNEQLVGLAVFLNINFSKGLSKTTELNRSYGRLISIRFLDLLKYRLLTNRNARKFGLFKRRAICKDVFLTNVFTKTTQLKPCSRVKTIGRRRALIEAFVRIK